MRATHQIRRRQFMELPDDKPFTVVDAFDKLFKQWFEGESWNGWRAILKAAYALPMTESEIQFFKSVSGGRDPPKRRVRELWCCCGRRAGKDSVASAIAAYTAAFFRGGLDRLRPGERAMVQLLARDRTQAGIVLGYIRSYFDFIPPLNAMVERRTSDGLALRNDVDVVVSTNSFRAVRGRAVLVSVFDEVAYWMDERSARPDLETYNAIKPGLATLDGMLIGISSPYRKSGLLWSKYKKHFGENDDDCLVIQADSARLNPTLDPAIIAKAYEDDLAVARAEWGAEFRDDISGFVDAEIIAACVADGVREVSAAQGIKYFGFVDPSGGSADSMTMAIAHREADRVIIDCVRERRPPFSPADVCLEFSATLKLYNIGTVQSDKYAGGWPVEAFGAVGVRVEQAAKPKSELYVDLLPLINARRIQLLDVPRLISQLCGLERRTARGGRDSIDHSPGGHDDVANAVAGAAALAIANVGVVVTAELLARAMAMPPRPGREHFAWSFGQRARAAQQIAAMIPDSKKCYPAGVLSADKFAVNPTEGDD
jgi:hypothetical protein